VIGHLAGTLFVSSLAFIFGHGRRSDRRDSHNREQDQATGSYYCYEPLVSGSNSVRFAYLLPGSGDDRIRGRLALRMVSLTTDRKSYNGRLYRGCGANMETLGTSW
jgi:hypothetical protein